MLLLFLGGFCLGLSACNGGGGDPSPPGEPDDPGGARSTLGLSVTELDAADGEVVVALVYRAEAGTGGPRVMELFLRHSGSLSLVNTEPGPGVTEAGKQLVVQRQPDNRVRTVIFSGANLNRLSSGVLATYRFERAGPGPATVELLTERPIFAPAEANRGLIVGDPLHVSLGSR